MQYDTDEEEVVAEKPAFDRGTALSIFTHDRYEDVGALVAAMLIAVSMALLFR